LAKLVAMMSEQRIMASYKDVWVFAEQVNGCILDVSLEVLGKARQLAARLGEEVVAVLVGAQVTGAVQNLIAAGADRVYVAEHWRLKNFLDEPYADIWEDLCLKHQPNIILMGATLSGRALAAKLAARFHTGLTADCTGLEIEAGTNNLLQIRPTFGGSLLATIICPKHRPQMATIRPKTFPALPLDWERSGRIIPVNLDTTALQSRLEIVRSVEAAMGTDGLEQAEVIVAGGRGLGTVANFQYLYELAKLLDGQVAASRAAVDAGWLEPQYQIGQTGRVVHPKIYFACGIHGAVQHLTGMQNAEVIIAINHDPAAPIFKIADYGIIGDVCKVLPELIKRLQPASTFPSSAVST
jgi:electron transfer flavoprotein alpha subunit